MDFKPATFYDDDRSLAKKIEFPDIQGDIRILVRCFGFVLRQGNLIGSTCLAPSDDQFTRFERAVLRAAKNNTKLVPARVNDRRRTIWMLYSVLFTKKGNYKIINVYPHHFNNYEEYGMDYSAPQLYYTRKVMEQYCKKGFFLRLWSLYTVKENGIPDDIAIFDEENYSDLCVKQAIQEINYSKFIPAIQDSKYFSAKYQILYFNKVATRFYSN